MNRSGCNFLCRSLNLLDTLLISTLKEGGLERIKGGKLAEAEKINEKSRFLKKKRQIISLENVGRMFGIWQARFEPNLCTSRMTKIQTKA